VRTAVLRSCKRNRCKQKHSVRSLAAVFRTSQSTYAYCGHCGEIYLDDVPAYGSLRCPKPSCRGFALLRGLLSPSKPTPAVPKRDDRGDLS
jgi:hypothetical protein